MQKENKWCVEKKFRNVWRSKSNMKYLRHTAGKFIAKFIVCRFEVCAEYGTKNWYLKVVLSFLSLFFMFAYNAIINIG